MRRSAALRSLIAVAAIGLVWGGLLPAVARIECVARHVAAMEAREVNPSAMVYTELDRLPVRPRWVEDRLTLWP
jgi:hypothetical protein